MLFVLNLGTIPHRPSSLGYCQPVQFDGLLANLGMELNAFALVVIRFGLASSAAKDARGALSHGLLPVGNLDVVEAEILCDLLDRFDALECLKRNAGFEFEVIISSFTLHLVCVRFGFYRSRPPQS
jgi:hypothetical protein